jgi:hypothetical protein
LSSSPKKFCSGETRYVRYLVSLNGRQVMLQ